MSLPQVGQHTAKEDPANANPLFRNETLHEKSPIQSGFGKLADAPVFQQPQPVKLMNGQPVGRLHQGQVADVASEQFQTGLLCVCEGGAGSCLYGFCCPPCATASARTRFDGSDWWMNLFFLNSYTSYKIIAEGYNIDTDPCCNCYTCQFDICRGFWCMPCTVVQILNEVKSRDPLGPKESNAIYHGPSAAINPWNYGLCSCLSNMSTCPFITAAGIVPVLDLWALSAFNAQALTLLIDHHQHGHGLTNMEHGYNCSDGCFTCGYNGWWFNFCCVNSVITRNYIRDESGIGGCCKFNRCLNIFMEDVVPTWFCYWCSTCQNVNEVLYKTENEGDTYEANQAMNELKSWDGSNQWP